jgi:protein-S-isoprenylcysteine O-methyltransferase Ste14
VGLVLVGLQFALLGVLLVGALLGISEHGLPVLSGLTGMCAALSIALAVLVGALALAANRPGNFRIVPTPKAGGNLVTHGIYTIIRHPMYTSVLLLGAGFAWVAGLTWGGFAWGVWVALFGVLLLKANAEERALLALYPSYAAYRAKTWRFVAWVF